MARLLLDRGAKVDPIDERENTPLSLAAKNGQIETARLLLARGADRHKKDIAGKTPLDHAREQGHDDIASLLEGK